MSDDVRVQMSGREWVWRWDLPGWYLVEQDGHERLWSADRGFEKEVVAQLDEARKELAAARAVGCCCGPPLEVSVEFTDVNCELQQLQQELAEARAQLARGVAHAQERVGLVQDLEACQTLLREACETYTDSCVVASEDGKYSKEYGVDIVGSDWYERARAAGGTP